MWNYIKNLTKLEKFLFALIITAIVAIIVLPESYENATSYVPPKISELEVSSGTISFTHYYKGSGGELIIRDGKSVIQVTCAPVNRRNNFPCYRMGPDADTNFKKDVAGKHGKIWWSKVTGRNDDNGRLYQLEVDGKTYISYDFAVKYYSDKYKQLK